VLRFIKRARDLGFSIERIRRLLDLWRDKSRASRDVKRLTLDHIAEITARIAAMSTLRPVRTLCDAWRRALNGIPDRRGPDRHAAFEIAQDRAFRAVIGARDYNSFSKNRLVPILSETPHSYRD
jgi:MerR family copper efflux transcriptional regulator